MEWAETNGVACKQRGKAVQTGYREAILALPDGPVLTFCNHSNGTIHALMNSNKSLSHLRYSFYVCNVSDKAREEWPELSISISKHASKQTQTVGCRRVILSPNKAFAFILFDTNGRFDVVID